MRRGARDARRAAGSSSKADYRGDFQMHSTWSDGGESLEDDGGRGAWRSGTRASGSPTIRTACRSRGACRMEQARAAVGGDRRAERAVCGPFPRLQGHRGEHPRGRRPRRLSRGAGGCSSSSWHRRTRCCAEADDQTARMLARGPGAGRGDPRASARPHVQQPSGHHRRLGRGVRGRGRARRRDRARRQLAPAGHRLPARGPRAGGRLHLRARQRRALDRASCGSATTRSRTRGSPASPPSG